MPKDIETINICGEEILGIRSEEGEGYVVVHRICEVLKVTDRGQVRKLKNAKWARTIMMIAPDGRGRNQEFFCLHVDDVPMWLGGINVNKVANKELQPKLIEFQRQAARTLADWAYGRREEIVVPLSPAEQLVAQAQALLEQERRLTRLELANKTVSEKSDELDRRIHQIEIHQQPEPEQFTVMGYANLHGWRIALTEANLIGRRASRLSREQGYGVDKVRDPRFGRVGSYHVEILRQAFAERGFGECSDLEDSWDL